MPYYPIPPYAERVAFHREFWRALATLLRRTAKRLDHGEA